LIRVKAVTKINKFSWRLTEPAQRFPIRCKGMPGVEERGKRSDPLTGQELFMLHAHATRECTITCPHCSTAKSEVMPSDACLFFYECSGCGALLKRKPGTCCVFCSYGSVPCPPVQAARACEKTGQSSLYL